MKNHAQHQSDAYRALDAKCRIAAGWDSTINGGEGGWKPREEGGREVHEPGPLTIRIKESGVVVKIGYEPARERVITGKAELVDDGLWMQPEVLADPLNDTVTLSVPVWL